jgi:hypothetical protein
MGWKGSAVSALSEQEVHEEEDQHGAYTSAAPLGGGSTGEKTPEEVVHGGLLFRSGSSGGLYHVPGTVHEQHVRRIAQVGAFVQVDGPVVRPFLAMDRIHEQGITHQVIHVLYIHRLGDFHLDDIRTVVHMNGAQSFELLDELGKVCRDHDRPGSISRTERSGRGDFGSEHTWL